MKSNRGSFFNNLSKKQRSALESLEADQNIVIMPSDKDSSIVILNKNDYNEECLKILCDRHFYEELKEDPSASYKGRFTEIIQKLLHDKLITKNEYDILLEGNETPTFYALAKTHKIFEKLPPFWPICNGKNSVSVRMSEFVDSFLKPASRLARSYIRDTTDFIKKISGLKFIPECPKEKVFIVFMDVQSLYPNIDHKEGIDSCSHVLDKRTNQSFPARVFVKSIQWSILPPKQRDGYGHTNGS